jgi:hypothetical protein
MIRNRERYLESGNCVNVVVYSKSAGQSKWSMSNGNKNSACDLCINKERICARLVEIDKVIKLVIFPLPVRPNSRWNELEYWV